MTSDSSLSLVKKIMTDFSALSGLYPKKDTPERYLWTDAFAVCNFFSLYTHTKDKKYQSLAVQLVEQVHHTLGRHRTEDTRKGWISGLDEAEGEKHPTIGGIRIGKKEMERDPSEPLNQSLEWDRDGQYFHYLTKWMHALNVTSLFTSDTKYLLWAIELAKTAHARFSWLPPQQKQKYLHWKMSIDLTRPLVPSMGQHDPLDGLLTYRQLQAHHNKSLPNLRTEIQEMEQICKGKSWKTKDLLGLGGLLCDIYRVGQILTHNKSEELETYLHSLLDPAHVALQILSRENNLHHPAQYRLAFRELGLSIGIKALLHLQTLITAKPESFKNPQLLAHKIATMANYRMAANIIDNFWLQEANRKVKSWEGHRNINMVMLATSLSPEGYLNVCK